MSDDLRRTGEEALSKLGSEEEQEDEAAEVEELGQLLREHRAAPPEEKPKEQPEPSAEDAEKIKAERKARLANILSRGQLNDKLQSVYDACVPEGRAGKFVRDTDEALIRYGNLGFEFIYTDGALALHGAEGNRVRVGDVVLMTISLEDRELLREIRHERMVANMNKGRKEWQNKSQEEAERGGAHPFVL